MNIKFFIIPYIALGCVLSGILQITYHSGGDEWLPTFYGSPFVYKKASATTSLEYFYSILGLVGNILVWSIMLYLIDKGIIQFTYLKNLSISYRILVALLLVLTTIQVLLAAKYVGTGFDESNNYWYWNIDKIAEEWGTSYSSRLNSRF